MRIPRIYTSTQLELDNEIQLSDSTSHYLLKVLRMEVGRELVIFDGQGGEYSATLVQETKKIATIKTTEFFDIHCESDLNTHLGIGLSRGERFDWVLQKATELGVTEITPLITERTEVKISKEKYERKNQHWQAICVSACEQSERNQLPKLNTLTKFDDFIDKENSGLCLVLHHRSEKRVSDFERPKSVVLLVGPEGGLSDDEIQRASAKRFSPLTLGPRVLRTETAPIVALSAAQTLWGDF